MKNKNKIDGLIRESNNIMLMAYEKGYKDGISDGNINNGLFSEKVTKAYENGLNDAWKCAGRIYDFWFNICMRDPNKFSDLLGLDAKLGESVFEKVFSGNFAKLFIFKLRKIDNKTDWHDIPADEMTEEQLRQAVKDLRKKLQEKNNDT